MPLASPQTITIGADALVFKRTNQDNFGSTFLHKGVGFEVQLKIRHSYESKKTGQIQFERHNVDITKSVFNADGSVTVLQSYIVLRNVRGAAVAPTADLMQALCAFTTTNADALVEWEN